MVPQVHLAAVSIKWAGGDLLLPVELLTSLLSLMPEPTARATAAVAKPSAGESRGGGVLVGSWWSGGSVRNGMVWIGVCGGVECAMVWYGLGVQWCVRVLLMCQRPQQGLCSSPQWSRTTSDSLLT